MTPEDPKETAVERMSEEALENLARCWDENSTPWLLAAEARRARGAEERLTKELTAVRNCGFCSLCKARHAKEVRDE